MEQRKISNLQRWILLKAVPFIFMFSQSPLHLKLLCESVNCSYLKIDTVLLFRKCRGWCNCFENIFVLIRHLCVFAKFTGKHLCQSLHFIKKETLAQVFSCEFCEISRKNFLKNLLIMRCYLCFCSCFYNLIFAWTS